MLLKHIEYFENFVMRFLWSFRYCPYFCFICVGILYCHRAGVSVYLAVVWKIVDQHIVRKSVFKSVVFSEYTTLNRIQS
jgi:hypothetical protein